LEVKLLLGDDIDLYDREVPKVQNTWPLTMTTSNDSTFVHLHGR